MSSAKHDRDDREETLLATLTEEARTHWAPRARQEHDEADGSLFARLEAHDAQRALRVRSGGSASFWGPVAFITAVAAGVVLFAHPRGEVASARPAKLSPEPPLSRPSAPAQLRFVGAGGEVRVDGVGAFGAGLPLQEGQRLEARGSAAAFSAPGRVEWLLESGTEVSAVRTGSRGGAIVLALKVGAVEAQVTPVPAGEAFAVDVDGVRVAVHGTHLRVSRAERNGAWVVVDLSEGVISVGAPPKVGSTVGRLVTAPAHVEFSVADVEATLRIDHDASRLRASVDPASLAESAEPQAPGGPPPSMPTSGALGSPPAFGSSLTASASVPPTVPTATAIGLHGRAAAPVLAAPTPVERLEAAVRACSDQTNHGGSGTITIRSTLTVDVKEDGLARLASFDPPLVPDLQACVGAAVYAIRWNEPGAHRVPIELHR